MNQQAEYEQTRRAVYQDFMTALGSIIFFALVGIALIALIVIFALVGVLAAVGITVEIVCDNFLRWKRNS